MALAAEQIQDLVKSVQTKYPFKGWTSVAQKQNQYVAFDQFFKGKQTVEQSSPELGFTVKYKYKNSAEFVGLFHEVGAVSVENTMVQGKVPFRNIRDDYAYDMHEESFNTNDSRQIFDMIKSRREDAWMSVAERMETNFWGNPANIVTTTDPFPAKYWLTVPSGAAGSFCGNYHTSFTSKGGISPTLATRWRNWADTYTAITEDDLWAKILEAMDKTRFKSPVPGDSSKNPAPQRTLGMSYATKRSIEQLAEQRNENLGKEAYYGAPTFKGVPLLWVPNLDADNEDTPQSYDAVVGIDWSTFGIKFQKGWTLKEGKPIHLQNQPNVVRVDMDCTYNTFCDGLRSNFVIANNYLWSPSA
jgi:hypothetical protein